MQPSPAKRGSVTTTRGIRVWVAPSFLTEQVAKGESGEAAEEWRGKRYLFAYHIRITNVGTVRAQLLERHWVIVDADGDRHEVRGEGVVGHQPDLKPGETFEYSSGCPIATPWGTMEGEFSFVDEHGERFDAVVGRFYLVSPRAEAVAAARGG